MTICREILDRDDSHRAAFNRREDSSQDTINATLATTTTDEMNSVKNSPTIDSHRIVSAMKDSTRTQIIKIRIVRHSALYENRIGICRHSSQSRRNFTNHTRRHWIAAPRKLQSSMPTTKLQCRSRHRSQFWNSMNWQMCPKRYWQKSKSTSSKRRHRFRRKAGPSLWAARTWSASHRPGELNEFARIDGIEIDIFILLPFQFR